MDRTTGRVKPMKIHVLEEACVRETVWRDGVLEQPRGKCVCLRKKKCIEENVW